MASIKISELDNVTTLVDSDALPIVNGNKTKKVTISKLGDILATKNYVNEVIGDIGSTGFTPIIVETLPTSNISTNTVYLVLNEQQADKNIYNEYIYVGGKWEIVGSTAVDLSDYYTKDEVDNKINIVSIDVSGFWSTSFKSDGSGTGYASSNTNVSVGLQEIAKIGANKCIIHIYNRYSSMLCVYANTYNHSDGGWGAYYTGVYQDRSGTNGSKCTITTKYSSTGSPQNMIVNFDYGDGFVSKDNVLTKTNTTSYTPSANYHPATKKYVDDAIANIDVPEGGGNTIQYKVMPNSETIEDGTIVQYVGETNQDYTNGFWYKWVNRTQWEQINVQKELVAGNNIEIKDGVISAIGNSIPFITISDGFTNNGEYDVISNLMTKWYKENNRLDNFAFINKSTYNGSNISIWVHMYGTGTGSNTIPMQKITFSSPPSLANNDLKNYYVSFSEWSFRFTINADATVTYQGKTHVRAHGTLMDLKNYDGYDATKTQILKNINGTIKWEEVNVTEVSEAEY